MAALKIEITKHLEDVDTEEESNLVYSCELSHDIDEVQWYLNDTPLLSNNFNEIKKKGKRHTLILKGVTLEDTGTVMFKVRNVTETAQLNVRGKHCYCLYRMKMLKFIKFANHSYCNFIQIEVKIDKDDKGPRG